MLVKFVYRQVILWNESCPRKIIKGQENTFFFLPCNYSIIIWKGIKIPGKKNILIHNYLLKKALMQGYLAIMVSRCLREPLSLGRDSIRPLKNNLSRITGEIKFLKMCRECTLINCLREKHHSACSLCASSIHLCRAVLGLHNKPGIYGMQA